MADARKRGTATVDLGDVTATALGQPDPGSLPLSTRLVVEGSAAADIALRTAVASLAAAPGLLWALRGSPGSDIAEHQFYRELAAQHDPALSFPEPVNEVKVTIRAPGMRSFRARDGRVESLRFKSPFVPLNPAAREPYAQFERNGYAWAQHWRHDDGPRPTLAVIHGFMASPYEFNSAFFALPWLFHQGYDLLLYVLPFHGQRREKNAPFSGWGLFGGGISRLNEAMGHAVHDFRLFVDYLESTGVEQVGVTGLSLGGYTSALLSTVEDRLKVVIPNAAVTSIGPLVKEWFPANLLISAGTKLASMPRDELDETLLFSSPLNYGSVVERERRMIIGGLGDRLAPPEQSRWLWEHWNRCRLHWYPGNHAFHVRRGDYLRELLAFMQGVGFAPDA